LPGDRVAIFADTREEWVVVDMAILLAGAITVPVYPTLTSEQAAFTLSDSGAKVVFVGDREQLEKVRSAEAARMLGTVERIVVFDPDLAQGRAGRVLTLAALGDPSRAADVAERVSRITPDDLASVVYTSGTTGTPKGVMLTHGNFAFEVSGIADLLGLSSADEQLLFLPLAHIFAKILVIAQLEIGFCTTFAESVPLVMDNMLEVEPTFFGAVPRLYEKVHAVVTERAVAEGSLKERLFRWSLAVAERAAEVEGRGGSIGRLLALERHYADKLVLSKIRGRFGRRLRFALTGGAPLGTELAAWFHSAGVLILEGYGLTETTGASHVNRPDRARFGTVGSPLPGVEVKLDSDGEVLVRGPNVMKGYYNRPEETAELIDEEGWFRTGDIGDLDGDGRLTITDRKKDLIVTAGGKKVAPQSIEGLLVQSPWVSQALVHGDRRKYLVALLSLDPAVVSRWARESGRIAELRALSTDPELRELIEMDIDAINRRLAPFETIKRFAILDRDLSLERGELTPTLKIKRKVVYERYRKIIEGMYEADSSMRSMPPDAAKVQA